MHVLIVRGGLKEYGYCDEASHMGCYLSAIIHDYKHKGVNNDFLVRVSDSLALLYNDKSPMENHHLAAAFTLMNSPEFNFMSKMPKKTWDTMRNQIIDPDTMRNQIIDLVLATDMKQHFALHSMFQSKLQIASRPKEGSSMGTEHHPIDENHRSLVLQMALKCADLGHLACEATVHTKWAYFLEEEFFRQGDREKHEQLQVSPLMDRGKIGISKSQVGFFDIVALPLFQCYAQAFPQSQPLLDAVKNNYEMWREDMMLFSVQGMGI
eukprot:gene14589-20640_t